MSKVTVKPFRPIYPTPVALITSVSSDGVPNIITLGEVFNVALKDPAIVGVAIRKATYSHELISANREFTVNLPSTDLVEQTDWCGTHSGRDGNKFDATGLTPIPATHIQPPLVAECPVNIECTVLSIQKVGDHDLFLGEVKAVHVDEALMDERGHVDLSKADPFCFMFNLTHRGEYRSIGGRLARAWSTTTDR